MKNEEKLLHAIGQAADRRIAEAMDFRREHKPAVLRWVAVAACVCLLLASPVGASVVDSIIEEFRSVRAPERYSVSALPQELLEEAKVQDESIFIPTDSMEEAMELVGLKHLENHVLESAEPKEVHTTTETGEEYESAFQAWMKVVDGEIWVAVVDGWYTMKQSTVSVTYILTTEQAPTDGGFAFDPEELGLREEYTTPSGLECILYTRNDADNDPDIIGYTDCVGFAARGGCLIYVTVGNPQEEIAMSTLRQILDAYG